MPVTVDLVPDAAVAASVCTLPVHVGTNGQVSSWGAPLAGFPPTR
ncbi:hypothetical protein ACPYO6_10315 [Georgenia sp. Z1344]